MQHSFALTALAALAALALPAMTLFATPLAAQAGPADWTAGPFDMPESAIYDSTAERIILSVMVGHPAEADGNGALALLSPEGSVIDPGWVTGLDAPKGMAIVGRTLLVADLTRLHEVDLETGSLLRSHDVAGAVFLNDVTSDGLQAFVSDFMTNRIWHYAAGEMRLWLEDAALEHPNGLLLEGSQLLIGSWGDGIAEDFSTRTPGSLLSVDLEDQSIRVLSADLGNLDGVVRIGGQLLVNDWITGHLFEIRADGTAEVVAKHAPGLADISGYGDTLLLPSMLEGSLSSQTYP